MVDKEFTAAWMVEYVPPDVATCRQPEGVVVRLAASTAVALSRRWTIDFILTCHQTIRE